MVLRAHSAEQPTFSRSMAAPGSMTTAEHLRQPGWWPTKQQPTQDGYVGTRSCATCHADIALSQQASQMARTLGRAGDSAVLHAHLQQDYRSGPYTSTLHQTGNEITVSVTDARKVSRRRLVGALALETSAKATCGRRTAPSTRAGSTTSPRLVVLLLRRTPPRTSSLARHGTRPPGRPF